MRAPRKYYLFICSFAIGISISAHVGKPHVLPASKTANSNEKAQLTEINELYLSEVKPIFEKKCFDCHGPQGRSPWYRNIPIAKQLIDHDIYESKEHLDMTSDFPFKSHASPLADVVAIDETVMKNEMPPFRYRVMHQGSTLTGEEKAKVHRWVQFAKEILIEKTK